MPTKSYFFLYFLETYKCQWMNHMNLIYKLDNTKEMFHINVYVIYFVGTRVVRNIPLRCSKVINHPKSDSCIVLGILWSEHSKENQGRMSNKPKSLAKPKVFLFFPSGFPKSRSGSVFQSGSQFQLSNLLQLIQK